MSNIQVLSNIDSIWDLKIYNFCQFVCLMNPMFLCTCIVSLYHCCIIVNTICNIIFFFMQTIKDLKKVKLNMQLFNQGKLQMMYLYMGLQAISTVIHKEYQVCISIFLFSLVIFVFSCNLVKICFVIQRYLFKNYCDYNYCNLAKFDFQYNNVLLLALKCYI